MVAAKGRWMKLRKNSSRNNRILKLPSDLCVFILLASGTVFWWDRLLLEWILLCLSLITYFHWIARKILLLSNLAAWRHKKKEVPFLFINFLASWEFQHPASSRFRKWQHQQPISLSPARAQWLALLAGWDAAQAIAHDARPWLLTTWNNFAHSNSAWDATGVWHGQVLCFSRLCNLPFSIQNSVWKVPLLPFCPYPC